MGNYISKSLNCFPSEIRNLTTHVRIATQRAWFTPPPISVDNNTCLICLEIVDSQTWIKCIRCNILLHNTCAEIYNGEKKYCKCPHCQRIGTMYNDGHM